MKKTTTGRNGKQKMKKMRKKVEGVEKEENCSYSKSIYNNCAQSHSK